jgi:hypothetical protein
MNIFEPLIVINFELEKVLLKNLSYHDDHKEK